MPLKIIGAPQSENYYGWQYVVIDESVQDADYEGNVAAFQSEADANAYVASR